MTNDLFLLALPKLRAEVSVTRFTGTEAMNALYDFEVHVRTAADEGFARRAIESPACFRMLFGGFPTRRVHGIVACCEATAREASGSTTFVLRIVPRMARLKQRRSSRIFQDQTAREIVEQVLSLSGIQNRWQLARELQKRTYCVQYDETDYDFVTRLLASEGIFFSFEHPMVDEADLIEHGQRLLEDVAGPELPEEVLLLADSAEAYAPIDGSLELKYRPPRGNESALEMGEDHARGFRLRHAMRPKRVLFRRYDFEKPPIPRRDAASVDAADPVDDRKAMGAFVDRGATIYEHQHAREQALLDPLAAKIALEAETADAVLAEADTASRRLLPGRRFRLVDHDVSELDGEYVVLSSSHEGHAPEWTPKGKDVYHNHVEAAPAHVPARPERPRRTVRQTLETATVVGPKMQEIHTDEHGRVKVQFHWDLDGEFDEKASAWLRVAQPWAGAGYGAIFIPRVGHEVLVGHIDGDADRPVIIGSLYNGSNPPPHTLPRDRAMSAIKTWSTPGGAGGHELLFDDTAGSELVSLRSVGRVELSSVADSTVNFGEDVQSSIGGNHAHEVAGNAKGRIGGSEVRVTMGSRNTTIATDDSLGVDGLRTVRVLGDESHRTDGILETVVGMARSTAIGTDPNEPAHDFLAVTGQYEANSGREMRLSSKRRITLACGESTITLTPTEIILSAPNVQIQATNAISLAQGDPAAATMVLRGGSAAIAAGVVTAVGGGIPGAGTSKLVLDPYAHLDAPLVKLNCGIKAGGGAPVVHAKDETGPVRFTVSADGLPPDTTSVTLVIATPDGEVIERECAPGDTVTLQGRIGTVFTVVDMKVGDSSVPVGRKETP